MPKDTRKPGTGELVAVIKAFARMMGVQLAEIPAPPAGDCAAGTILLSTFVCDGNGGGTYTWEDSADCCAQAFGAARKAKKCGGCGKAKAKKK